MSLPLLNNTDFNILVQAGLGGMTFNPAILAKAIGETDLYDERIQFMSAEGRSDFEIYDILSTELLQLATDKLARTYERTNADAHSTAMVT